MHAPSRPQRQLQQAPSSSETRLLPLLPCNDSKVGTLTSHSARSLPNSATLGRSWSQPASLNSAHCTGSPKRTFLSSPNRRPTGTPNDTWHGSLPTTTNTKGEGALRLSGNFNSGTGSSSDRPVVPVVLSCINPEALENESKPKGADPTLSSNSNVTCHVDRKGEFKINFAVSTGLPKKMQVAEIDRFLVAHGGRLHSDRHRYAAYRKVMEELTKVYPAMVPISAQMNRYLKELNEAAHRLEASYAKAYSEQSQTLFEKFETFFEEKIYGILRDQKKAEKQAALLHDEIFQLRKERDEDLMTLKVNLMKRLNECERREDDMQYFRHLIAAVFKTNGQLTNRIEDLELILKKHRLDIPPAAPEMYAYKGTTYVLEEGTVSTERVMEPQQVNSGAVLLGGSNSISPEFMKASKEELNFSRLTLQQELLHCAFDDRSSYRLQISSLRHDNNDLKFKVSQLEDSITQLNRYIHEKRFLGMQSDGSPLEALTPRPRDVPFSIQTELGINMHKSTSAIFSEMTAVANNLKHQLNSSLVRLRQLTTVSEWMQEDTLIELDVERNEIGVVPTFGVSMWASIPHFLRTRVTPDVSNLKWTQSDAGAVFLQFFQSYRDLRAMCRFVCDTKMVAPRRVQQYTRREIIMSRLDASKEELIASEDNVPFGYVVSHFIYTLLMQLSPGSKENALFLPGTLNPRFTNRGETHVVELEFTRFAYNMWWSAYRYRHTQPLCHLFAEVVSGRLPHELFGQMERSLQVVRRAVSSMDVDGSRTFTYARLVGGVLRMVSDLDSQAARCGILAVVQTFEENGVPIVAGRVRQAEVLADESFVGREPHPSSGAVKTTTNNMPPSITIRRLPGKTVQPPGASVFVRYWRRLIIRRYERVYNLVERILSPLVVESEIVLGLYLLPVPEALSRVARYHEDVLARTAEYQREPFPTFPEDAEIPVSDDGPLAPGQGRVPTFPDLTKEFFDLVRTRAKAVRTQETAENILLMSIVEPLLADMPRLSRSVHFPFRHAKADRTMDSSGAGVAVPPVLTPEKQRQKTSKKRKHYLGRSSTSSLGAATTETPGKSSSSQVHDVPVAEADKTDATEIHFPEGMDREIVEWYAFCYQLRQRALSFSEKLFTTVDPMNYREDSIPEAAEGEEHFLPP